MKANELRIQNYILVKCVAEEIKGIDDFEVHKVNPYNIISIHENCRDWQAEPIPLTEEWLLKFGFEQDGVLVDYAICLSNDKILGVDLKNKRAHCYHIKPSIQGANLCSVEYVHQLQNLYFALTNKEL